MQLPPERSNNKPGSNQPPSLPPRTLSWLWISLLIILGLWLFFRVPEMLAGLMGGEQAITVPYSVFYDQVIGDNVDQVLIEGSQITGIFKRTVTWPAPGSAEAQAGIQPQTSRLFTTTLLPVSDPALPEALREHGVTIVAREVEPSPVLTFILNWAPLLLLVGFFVWTMRRTQRQAGDVFSFGRSRARERDPERPQVTFSDVAGEEAAKRELVEIVDFLRDPDRFLALGARIPRGVLLVGPPGTGKTLMARAVAGEANVAFFNLSASEFVEMFVGVGASRVRDLFTRAKAAAPSIVFIDELDAVGRRRGTGLGGGNDEREQTLNQLLVEMDGFEQNETVIVLAATNRPDVLDPALLRPGRFDRQVTVGLPDRQGREAILRIHTRKMPLAADVDLGQLAQMTMGFSGADLANLANEAALTAARRGHTEVTRADFYDAFDRLLLGAERPPLVDEHERRVVAYHEAGHALIAALTPEADPVLKVTIVPRGQALGVTAQLPIDDRRNYSREYLFARMMVALGGRAAEEIAIGSITTGAENDLRQVTSLARRMVAQFGMSQTVGPLNFGDEETQPFLGYSLSQGRSYSEATAAKIDAEVKRLVEDAHRQTRQLLQEHSAQLDRLAQELLSNEIVEQARVLEIARGEAVLAANGRGG